MKQKIDFNVRKDFVCGIDWFGTRLNQAAFTLLVNLEIKFDGDFLFVVTTGTW